jgi:hypothetical protein
MSPADLPASLQSAFMNTNIAFIGKVCQSSDPVFERLAKIHGVTYCFHGSKLSFFHSILQNGLHVMSNTRHMARGNIFGDGIYFSKSVTVAASFASSISHPWRHSTVVSRDAIFLAVCQIICDSANLTTLPATESQGTYFVLHNEKLVRLEYLVVIQPQIAKVNVSEYNLCGAWSLTLLALVFMWYYEIQFFFTVGIFILVVLLRC